MEGFFALPVWGAYIWWGLYKEGLIFPEFYTIDLARAKSEALFNI